MAFAAATLLIVRLMPSRGKSGMIISLALLLPATGIKLSGMAWLALYLATTLSPRLITSRPTKRAWALFVSFCFGLGVVVEVVVVVDVEGAVVVVVVVEVVVVGVAVAVEVEVAGGAVVVCATEGAPKLASPDAISLAGAPVELGTSVVPEVDVDVVVVVVCAVWPGESS